MLDDGFTGQQKNHASGTAAVELLAVEKAC